MKSCLPDSIQNISKDIACFAVCFISKRDACNPHREDCLCTRPLSDGLKYALESMLNDLMTNNEEEFYKMLNQLGVDDENCSVCSVNVFTEMIRDRQINWGRLVTIYGFSGCMAKYLLEKGYSGDVVVGKISDACGEFVAADTISEWIIEQGGWKSFENYFGDGKKQSLPNWQSLFIKGFNLVTSAVSVR